MPWYEKCSRSSQYLGIIELYTTSLVISFPSSSCIVNSSFSVALEDVTSVTITTWNIVSAILWRMAGTVTTTITIKINNTPGSENLNLPPTFSLPCLVNNKEQGLFLCVIKDTLIEKLKTKAWCQLTDCSKGITCKQIAAESNRFPWVFRFTTGCESHFTVWPLLLVNSTDSMLPVVYLSQSIIISPQFGTFSVIYL